MATFTYNNVACSDLLDMYNLLAIAFVDHNNSAVMNITRIYGFFALKFMEDK